MEGRENAAVVKPTNAVRATRKTLKESTKNCSCTARMGPSLMTRTPRNALATRVARLMPTFNSAAKRRAPSSASNTEPRNGSPKTSMISTSSVLLQRFEVMQIEAVKLLTNLEEKDAQNEHANQNVKGDSQLDHHRHSIGRAGCSKNQPMLLAEKPNDLGNRLAARDHHQKCKQYHGKRDAKSVPRDGGRQCADRLGQPKGKNHQAQPQ